MTAKRKLTIDGGVFKLRRFRYKDSGGNKCFIGVMGCQAGIELPEGEPNGLSVNATDNNLFVQELMEAYGLTREELTELQKANDWADGQMLQRLVQELGLVENPEDVKFVWSEHSED